MIPTSSAPFFFMANKKMFDAAGVQLPKEWTAEEFRQISKKLTKGEGQNKIYGNMWTTWDGVPFTPTYVALGSDSYLNSDRSASNFNNPLFKQSLKLRYDMQNVDKSELPYVEIVSQKLDERQLFMSEKVAIIYTGTWRIGTVKNTQQYPHDFIAAFLPMFKLTKDQKDLYYPGGQGDFLVMNAKSTNKDATWEFINYWSTEGSYDMATIAAKIPAWKKADAQKISTAILGENPEKLFDVESFKRVVLQWDGKSHGDINPKALPQIQKVLKEEHEKYFTDTQDLDKTMQNIISKSDKLIKEAKD